MHISKGQTIAQSLKDRFEYGENPDKTNGGELIFAYECAPLTGANATLLAYANSKIEDLDTRRQTHTKTIAELSVETVFPKQIELLSGYLDDWENVDFNDKRKVVDGLISQIRAPNDYVQIEWKI